MVRVTAAEWALRWEVLVRFEASGFSLAEFSEREGVALESLLKWQAHFAGRDRRHDVSPLGAESTAAPLFTELVRASDTVPQEVPIEILLSGGVVIRLRRGADVELLRAAVWAVKTCS